MIQTVIFMLILIVSPSLKLRSSCCLGSSFSFSIAWSVCSLLKWSCRATFKSKLSDLSVKPIPIKAERPEKENVSNFLVSHMMRLKKTNHCHLEVWGQNIWKNLRQPQWQYRDTVRSDTWQRVRRSFCLRVWWCSRCLCWPTSFDQSTLVLLSSSPQLYKIFFILLNILIYTVIFTRLY